MCWALEEAGIPYRVEGTSFHSRGEEHFLHHPFGQVPWLLDGDVSIFESGAILLYIGEKNDILLPSDAKGRSEVVEWVFAALNSVEMAAIPFFIFKISNDEMETPGRQTLDAFLSGRLDHMEKYVDNREWLAKSFSVADILMSDVLRLVDRFGGLKGYPACRAYVARATDRPAFQKAYADQLAYFAAADENREPD